MHKTIVGGSPGSGRHLEGLIDRSYRPIKTRTKMDKAICRRFERLRRNRNRNPTRRSASPEWRAVAWPPPVGKAGN